MIRIGLAAGLLGLASCALPARPVAGVTSGGRPFEEATIGSRLGSTSSDEERVGKNPDASLQQPGFGIGSPGYIRPGTSR